MAPITILADENIPFALDAFSTLGDVRLAPGRQISRGDLRDVDMLIVRSITPINADLLAGTRVRFVATATSGSDHVDVTDLDRLGIRFFAALGCNANAVAEYMAAAWVVTARRLGCRLAGRSVGIIGVGRVGSLVAEKARALGMTPVLNDPPKARETGSACYRPIADLLDCDIVTCHTPLTLNGPDPTWRLIGEPFLARLKPGAWFCNAGRGEVVDEAALHASLDRGERGAVILDVWENEPAIDGRLVSRVEISTPHIAGYSLEGKLNGTAMVYDAACRFLGVTPSWDAAAAAPLPTVPVATLDAGAATAEGALASVITAVYPIERDSAALRATAGVERADRGRQFDQLRKAYPVRREFRQTRVVHRGTPAAVIEILRALQFEVA